MILITKLIIKYLDIDNNSNGTYSVLIKEIDSRQGGPKWIGRSSFANTLGANRPYCGSPTRSPLR